MTTVRQYEYIIGLSQENLSDAKSLLAIAKQYEPEKIPAAKKGVAKREQALKKAIKDLKDHNKRAAKRNGK